MTGLLGQRYCIIRFLSVVAGVGGLIVVAPLASANVDILNTGGFESYAVGNLAGQHSWTHVSKRSAGATVASAATVQTTGGVSGSQGVEISRAAKDDSRWFVPRTAGLPSLPSLENHYIDISWDMKVEWSNLAEGSYGPFFGVEAYQDNTAAFGVLGALGVDANSGEILTEVRNSKAGADPVLFQTGKTITAFDTWDRFLIRMDFTGKTYSTYLNGTWLTTDNFADDGLTQFSDADITAMAAYDGSSLGVTGRVWIDNFKVQEVPEPSTMVLCLTALATLAGLAWRRR